MNINILQNPYILILTVILVLLLITLIFMKSKLHKQSNIILEHEEKIKFLRQISAECEHRNTTMKHDTEKEIMALNHMIEGLEIKLKDGTKNQVVAMLKAQRNKRAKALERAEIEG